MKIKELIPNALFGCIGYIDGLESANSFLSIFQANLPFIQRFNDVYFAFNVGDRFHFEMVKDAIAAVLPKAEIISSPDNKGHSFGTAELDIAVFNYAKRQKVKWLFKSSGDILLFPDFPNQQINPRDFYYLNGIGYGGMEKYEYNIDRIVQEDFYPQTNFYIMNIEGVDYINDSDYIKKTYRECMSNPNYNGRPWEFIPGWSCEDFLKQSVIRNNLTKEQLISEDKYRKLVNYIKDFKVHDPSHKNIKVGEICHFQYTNKKVVAL